MKEKETANMPFKRTILRVLPLILIGIFSFLIHIYHVGDVPKGVLVDEAALGYNAYSLLQTGKDEYGTPYPVVFRSFGDEKLPLYVYASLLPVKFFGLSAFSIRLISVISGLFLVFVAFALLRELQFDYWQSLIGAMITAVSSWTFILGRFAWESNLGLLLFSLQVLFSLKAIRTNKVLYYILVGISAGFVAYTYIPYRLIAGVVLAAFLGMKIAGSVKYTILTAIIFLLLLTPALPRLLSTSGSARFQQTTILNDPVYSATVNDRRTYCNSGGKNILCSLILNKPLEISYTALSTFFRIYSVPYLFIWGEQDQNYVNVEKFGLLPIFFLPFYFLGFFFLLSKWKTLKQKNQLIFLGVSLILCTIPIVITKTPIRIQMSALYIFILVIILFGYRYIHIRIVHYLFLSVLILYGCLLTFYFVHIHSQKYYVNEAAVKDISEYLGQRYSQSSSIYIEPFYAEPLIFYAFYNKINPRWYQQNITVGKRDKTGFEHATGLGKIHIVNSFKDAICSPGHGLTHALFVTNDNPSKLPSSSGLHLSYTAIVSGLNVAYVYTVSPSDTKQNCK